jgi:hypothetical protein
MKPRTFIICLTIIILGFVFQGVKTVNHVEKTINDNLTQQKATVENIGMVFDWYGLTIVDNIIKFSYGMQSKEDLKKILLSQREEKNKLLNEYFKTTTPDELAYMKLVKDNDVKIDLFIDKVLTEDISVNKSNVVQEMYSLTDPTVSAINEILNIKTSYVNSNAVKITQSLERFKHFLYSAAMLSVVISLPYICKKEKN